ncbi:hypothetical protein K504DRAFT_267030 [Pleomassaria siparia CBS 279.74]|uniref:Uncharacterized protein n=1 Tax=Pleomassaria siparia CBS 279.74 TaxID=1314801 RepID=A0A6G1KDX5_9PLEO|nr:hypothetical protein K504DRAFT_267030 [Pleomassaria siparia CBS 279.74]
MSHSSSTGRVASPWVCFAKSSIKLTCIPKFDHTASHSTWRQKSKEIILHYYGEWPSQSYRYCVGEAPSANFVAPLSAAALQTSLPLRSFGRPLCGGACYQELWLIPVPSYHDKADRFFLATRKVGTVLAGRTSHQSLELRNRSFGETCDLDRVGLSVSRRGGGSKAERHFIIYGEDVFGRGWAWLAMFLVEEFSPALSRAWLGSLEVRREAA